MFVSDSATEKHGNVQHLVDVFIAQRRYVDDYNAAISPFSTDDNFEGVHWFTHAAWASEEIEHLFPFRAKLLQSYQSTNMGFEEFVERFDRWPLIQVQRDSGMAASADGLVWPRHFCAGG